MGVVGRLDWEGRGTWNLSIKGGTFPICGVAWVIFAAFPLFHPGATFTLRFVHEVYPVYGVESVAERLKGVALRHWHVLCSRVRSTRAPTTTHSSSSYLWYRVVCGRLQLRRSLVDCTTRILQLVVAGNTR